MQNEVHQDWELPPEEIKTRYGHRLVDQESAGWGRYLLVTTPCAHAVAGTKLTREPAGVAYVDWLDRTHLQQKSDSLPDAADLVIGLGGGRALDASKFVAIDKQLPLILVPTVLSTGAIIHGHFSHYEGRTRQIGHSPWRNCEYVLVDFGVVLASPLHLTTAGLGDILCNYGGVAEWRTLPGAVALPGEFLKKALPFHSRLN